MTPRTLIEPARLAGGAVLRSQSDDRLVDLVRAGNDRAFEAIVHRYRAPLLRYCRRFLPAGRAEDAVQQAFLNAFRAIGADDRPIDLRPWLYRIAHNAALNALRAGARGDADALSEEVDGVERPDQAAERRERLAHVIAAVQALPPRQRDAVVLRELEGRSYEEIAAELQVSGGAVRQLLNRARTTLRASATAILPPGLVDRLAAGGGEPVAARIAEIVAAGGGAAVLAKAGTAVVVAGAVAGGAVTGPLRGGGDERPAERERVDVVAPTAAASSPATEPRSETKTGEGDRRTSVRRARRPPTRDGRRPASVSDDSPNRTDDRSGEGTSGELLTDDDRSGSNSGSDSDSSGSDSDSSGPGSGEPDVLAAPIPDDSSNSGPGSLNSGSGSVNSGSGSDSSGSGSSGSGSDER